MTKQTSPLRQRMIDDMAFRNMSPNTRKVYAYAVASELQLFNDLSELQDAAAFRAPKSPSLHLQANFCAARRNWRRTIPIG